MESAILRCEFNENSGTYSLTNDTQMQAHFCAYDKQLIRKVDSHFLTPALEDINYNLYPEFTYNESADRNNIASLIKIQTFLKHLIHTIESVKMQNKGKSQSQINDNAKYHFIVRRYKVLLRQATESCKVLKEKYRQQYSQEINESTITFKIDAKYIKSLRENVATL